MGYVDTERNLRQGGIVILDGGTGTELERRGVVMDPDAWCGPAALENAGVLETYPSGLYFCRRRRYYSKHLCLFAVDA